jgi:hypothetical protein
VIVCGVEIKGKEAILALVQSSPEESGHVKCVTKKLALLDDRDTKSLSTMKSAIEAFALQNKVDAFVIKSRQATGSRAGGGITFKIETLFQLSGTPAVFISPPTLAKFAKSNLGGVPTSVVGYQTDAYRAGAWHLSKT